MDAPPRRVVVVARDESEIERLSAFVADGIDVVSMLAGCAGAGDDADAVLIAREAVEEWPWSASQRDVLRAAVDQARDAVVILDARSDLRGPRVVYVNQRFLDVTKFVIDDVIGRPLIELYLWPPGCFAAQHLREAIAAGVPWDGEFEARTADGRPWMAEVHVAPVRDRNGAIRHYVGVLHDVTARKAAEARLHHLAHHDVLTGLPNRNLFLQRLGHAIEEADCQGKAVGVLFVDLDRFKPINDRLGHAVGDRVLREVAQRLQSVVRTADTVARIGGDEFTMVLQGLARPEDAVRVARKVLAAVSKPLEIDGHELSVTPSVGIACAPAHGQDAETLLHRADDAMYRAKAQGRATFALWSEDADEADVARAMLRRELGGAIASGGLSLTWSPIVDPRTSFVVGATVGLRWPGHSGVDDAALRRLLADLGLEGNADRYALRSAAVAARQLAERAGRPFYAVVPTSADPLADPTFADTVHDALRRAGPGLSAIVLAVPEPVLLAQDEPALGRLRAARAHGARIAVDRFGTGHLSLHHLRLFPIDRLLIDGSFIGERSGRPGPMARAMADVGRAFGLGVGAAGVENAAQARALAALGVTWLGGPLYDTALERDALERRLGGEDGHEARP